MDGSGAAYVTGWTGSSDFPTTPGAFDPSYNGFRDAFVVKLRMATSSCAYLYMPLVFASTNNPADLRYSTFLGGISGESGGGIAVDGNGAAYVTGYTSSSDFPTTPGAFDTTYNGARRLRGQAERRRLGSDLRHLPGWEQLDGGNSIAVDEGGAAYVTGIASSSDFPTTPGAFDTTYNGGDAFVVKLNAAGSALLYATFLGGSSYEHGTGIALDGSGAAYITGLTESSDFPTTPDAFDPSYNGFQDAFVVKLNAAGSALAYATFWGSNYTDEGANAIAVDGSGAAYITGFSQAHVSYPVPYNFVVKLNAAGSALVYATSLGGANTFAYGIAVDGNGAAYVTGYTSSSDFPTTPGAFDTTYNGADAFVVKLNGAGSALVYATFLGGSSSDGGSSIAVDEGGAAYVTGRTGSSDFPTTPGAFDTGFNGGYWDTFVVKLDAAGSALAYATFLGGISDEGGRGIALDGNGAAYVTGRTDSFHFPTTLGAFDTTYNGDDAFVAKLAMGASLLRLPTPGAPGSPNQMPLSAP